MSSSSSRIESEASKQARILLTNGGDDQEQPDECYTRLMDGWMGQLESKCEVGLVGGGLHDAAAAVVGVGGAGVDGDRGGGGGGDGGGGGGRWPEAARPPEAGILVACRLHEERHRAEQRARRPQLGAPRRRRHARVVVVHRRVRLDADGVQAGAVQRQRGHVGVAVGERVEPHGAPGQRALPPVRVLVPAQRLRAEELPLAVVAREHPRRLARRRRRRRRRPRAAAVRGARLGGGGSRRGGGGDGERQVEADLAGGGVARLVVVGRRLAADLGHLLSRFLAAALHASTIATNTYHSHRFLPQLHSEIQTKQLRSCERILCMYARYLSGKML